MTTYTISDHTADEWASMGRRSRQDSLDSFDRCDTDGFLSQWASDMTSRIYLDLADWAREGDEGGDVQEMLWPMMHNADGDWVPVHEFRYVSGRFGESVRIWHNRTVTWWNPSHARKAATKQANDERKGIRWGTVKAHVEAFTYGNRMSVGVALRPVPDSANAIVEVLATATYEDVRN